jgi:REP element-mobilizing transposase RayT
MPRQPRIQLEDAFYHVTLRGNNKAPIFLEKHDFERFLTTVKRYKANSDFLLYSYVLMSNHLHLLLETKKEPLSKIMQSISTSYAMYFNKKYSRVGHLFQGRFNSILCDKDAYLLELVRYIHLNPIRAGIAEDLKDYPWSSHSAYLSPDDFIDTEMVLEMLGGTHSYLKFLKAGLKNPRTIEFPKEKYLPIFGTEIFIENAKIKSGLPRLSPQSSNAFEAEKILSFLQLYYGKSREELITKSKTPKESFARELTIYLLRFWCKESISTLASRFSMHPGSISRVLKRLAEKQQETEFLQFLKAIKKQFLEFHEKG